MSKFLEHTTHLRVAALLGVLLALVLVLLTGCATVEDFCDNHGRACVVTGEVVVVAAVAVVAVEASHSGKHTQQNPAVAPVNVPPCTDCAK